MIDHESYMLQAIELARNAPKHPFGALIVDTETEEVLSPGWNQSSTNPTWHGEVVAINQLVDSGIDFANRSLAIYSTAEPCPMCQSAILWTGIETVVFGSSISYLEQLGWNQIGIRAHEVTDRTPFRECVLIEGVLESECNMLFSEAMKLRTQ